MAIPLGSKALLLRNHILYPGTANGSHRKLGGLTKTGNARSRRLLIEGTNSHRYPANISTEMQKRQKGLHKNVIDIAWKARQRLCKRYQ